MKGKKIFSILLTIAMALSIFSMPMGVSASTTNNPVINGNWADPDIDYFDCKYWIFPTTDGIIDENDGWWGGKVFHAFSSENMVDWKDEGVILDVSANSNEEAGLNENGVQIAYADWAYGHAWAPSIEKVGNKYYFYFVAAMTDEALEKYGYMVPETVEEVENEDGEIEEKITEAHWSDDKAIGVAVADSPTGPYVASDEPIVYPKLVHEAFATRYSGKEQADYIPSVIDPSIFVDDDGSAYMTFGNWFPCIVKFTGDTSPNMLEIDDSTIKLISGIPLHYQWGSNEQYAFMESVVLFKRGKKYYYTWSVNGTADDNYSVAYATTNNLNYSATVQGWLLQKDESNNVYGTAHQSILYIKDLDKCYISYGRLQTDKRYNSDGSWNSACGNYRQVCIDEITFTSSGELSVTPTNTGVSALNPHRNELVSTVSSTCTKKGKTIYKCTQCGKTTTETLALSSHKSVTDKAVSATYAKAGKTKGSHCKTCGKVLTAQKTVAKLTLAKPSSASITAKSKGFKLSWKKVSKATGYEVQYSTNSSYKNAKTYWIKSNKTLSKSVSKLKGKKKYYVRVRAYVTENGKKYYSSWVKKSVTTKK